jgi:hypothetical protein
MEQAFRLNLLSAVILSRDISAGHEGKRLGTDYQPELHRGQTALPG